MELGTTLFEVGRYVVELAMIDTDVGYVKGYAVYNVDTDVREAESRFLHQAMAYCRVCNKGVENEMEANAKAQQPAWLEPLNLESN